MKVKVRVRRDANADTTPKLRRAGARNPVKVKAKVRARIRVTVRLVRGLGLG